MRKAQDLRGLPPFSSGRESDIPRCTAVHYDGNHPLAIGGIAIGIVLIIPDSAVAERVSQWLGDDACKEGLSAIVDGSDGPPGTLVARARAIHGERAAMAFVARHESEALEALSYGADEVATPSLLKGAEGVLSLIERAQLRARLRAEHEQRCASLAHTEKLAALGTIVAGVAHEINNSLASLLLDVECLRSSLGPWLRAHEEMQRLLALGRDLTVSDLAPLTQVHRTLPRTSEAADIMAEISSAGEAIANIVRDLRVFGRSKDDEGPRLVRVEELLDHVIRLVGKEIHACGGVIERDFGVGVPPIVAPQTRLAQVFTNLLINAGHALREIKRPCHRVRVATRVDDEGIAISISDTGPGIPAEAIERIFEPFYTTKRSNLGTGMGLAISRTLLRKMGGDLIVESVYGDGATFVAFVPFPDESMVRLAQGGGRESPLRPKPQTKRTVLLVDDDERVLRAYARALRDKYDLLLASDGQEAIDLLLSGSSPDAIVSDMTMPDVGGRQFHGWLCANRPDLVKRIIFVSGASRSAEDEIFLRKVASPVLIKPVTRDGLVQAIDGVLSGVLGAEE